MEKKEKKTKEKQECMLVVAMPSHEMFHHISFQ